MSEARLRDVSLSHPDKLFIGGMWVLPSIDDRIVVIDATTEEPFLEVANARATDIARAVEAARSAFDDGPWPRLTHLERADFLRLFSEGLRERASDLAANWPRESGILFSLAKASAASVSGAFAQYADLADSFPFQERVQPSHGLGSGGSFGLLLREPVGVVGAIVPWNGPASLTHKVAPALLAGCTVVAKAAPQAPMTAYIMAEVAESIGLPAGVLNVLTADRDASEALVRDSRVDKIGFTGSTAAGRRIASICGDRIARVTLELGGKSAAVILDDADIDGAAAALAGAECYLSGQVCASLTRIIVTRDRHDELVEALASRFSMVRVGDPFDETVQMGPLSMREQRDRVEGYIAKGIAEGAKLVTGGGRPKHLSRGWFIEPTLFSGVDNSSTIAREEIFGPVLSVIPARDEVEAVEIANDTIYGLNASVFTPDVDRARSVANKLRTGTVGHNAMRSDFGIACGGFKQSGIGREGVREGLQSYLETKIMILDGPPSSTSNSSNELDD